MMITTIINTILLIATILLVVSTKAILDKADKRNGQNN